MKTKILIIIISLILINILFLNINIVRAAGLSDVITGGDDFIDAGTKKDDFFKEGNLQTTSKAVVNMLTVIGMCVAVVYTAILGIKFMIGSVEEKAQVKDALVPFVIGCVVIFGAFGIWSIVVNVLNNL